jgi:hypothetical protein
VLTWTHLRPAMKLGPRIDRAAWGASPFLQVTASAFGHKEIVKLFGFSPLSCAPSWAPTTGGSALTSGYLLVEARSPLPGPTGRRPERQWPPATLPCHVTPPTPAGGAPQLCGGDRVIRHAHDLACDGILLRAGLTDLNAVARAARVPGSMAVTEGDR